MNAIRRAAPELLWTLQWTLAITFFLLGLLKAGLPPEDLQLRLHLALGAPAGGLARLGWLEVAGGLLLVIPAVTACFPQLTPVAATLLAVHLALGAALHRSAVGLGHHSLDLGLALACAVVALGRSVVAPVAPIDLGPEPLPPVRRLRPVRTVAAAGSRAEPGRPVPADGRIAMTRRAAAGR